MTTAAPRQLDPHIARRVANLRLRARHTVEGVLSGAHRSPHRGASVVFVEHRDYRPGDDPRLLDWRVYARNDRHVIKRFEQETQLSATLVLDCSGSMSYGEEPSSKAYYAATLLAALGLVMLGQGDAVGAMTIDRELRGVVPPSRRREHLDRLLELFATGIDAQQKTNLQASLRAVAERVGRRGVIAVASDLLDWTPEALQTLSQLGAKGHDIIVFHVLHPDELELPFSEAAYFEGLEGEPDLEADPALLRESYQHRLDAFLEERRRQCTSAGARYTLARTDSPPEQVLARMLRPPRRKAWG